MLHSIRQKLAELWYKLVTLKSSPRKIALGFAVGIFLSYTPTFGFQTVLALGVAALLRVNPISTVVGVYLTNIFTAGPLYLLCYEVGCFVAGVEPSVAFDIPETGTLWHRMVSLATELFKRSPRWIALELLGGTIVGIASALPAYYLALFGVIRYRTARLNRRIRKMRERMELPAKEADDHSEATSDDARSTPHSTRGPESR